MRSTVVGLAMFCAACHSGSSTAPPTDPNALMTTLQDLAAFGPKHVGTAANDQAASYIQDHMTKLGLQTVRQESFAFPRWDLSSSSMTVTIDGAVATAPFDVFESSGAGHADGDVVFVNYAEDGDLVGVDLTGKIALVIRDPSFHRAAQYRNVTAKGAAAMLYLSIAPQNLRQVGSVRFDWEAMGTIPAITIGADDGAVIQAAVTGGKSVHATIDVGVDSVPSTGHNVIGVIPGERPEQILIGAHYDTWFAGSTDNGGGVAELLALADRRIKEGTAHYTLVFVAYDGEEVALYGGYDYLRKHKIVAGDPILAVLNFESPSALDADIEGLAHSNQPALDDALQGAGLNILYVLYTGMEAVAGFFGGIIPTDIQGTYRSGVPTVSTAVSGPYYHTTMDTPDQVDAPMLATATDEFGKALIAMMTNDPTAFAAVDPKLWTADVTIGSGDPMLVDAVVKDGAGALQAMVPAKASVLVDDYTLVQQFTGTTDANGHVAFAIPASVTSMGNKNRFLHVTAGPMYPLFEKIIALP